MAAVTPFLTSIDGKHDEMCRLVTDWGNINSHSYNLHGLEELRLQVARSFETLEGEIRDIPLQPHAVINAKGEQDDVPLGRMLLIRKRPEAPIQVLLGIHIDTVYPKDHPFQAVVQVDARKFRGPGITDAKGGLVILLKALEAFEQSPFTHNVGWEVFVNPDEEIGSPGSRPILMECTQRHHLGLLFESCLPNGSLIGARRGTGEYTIVVRGHAAHVGRNPEEGRNAIHALARFIMEIGELEHDLKGVTVNIAQVSGNGAVNVVPDLGVGRIGVRITHPDDRQRLEERLGQAVSHLNALDGIGAALHGSIRRPPKVLDRGTVHVLESLRHCAGMLGVALDWRPTGGASDGNLLANAGLPTVDSLGARGGNIHSADEYLEIDSLTERAKLVALYLMKLGAGEIRVPGRSTAS